MARTESTMLELGTLAPDFHLPDVVSGNTLGMNDLAGGQGLLVMFISRHCPYVQHVKRELARLAKDYRGKGIGIVAVASNYAPDYPDDAPGSLREFALEEGFEFPICYDGSQEAAMQYRAACTPDLFLFDRDRRLVYRGQLDASRPKTEIPVTGADLRAAMDAVLSGSAPSPEQRPSVGCNIKWRPGNAPEYFSV